VKILCVFFFKGERLWVDGVYCCEYLSEWKCVMGVSIVEVIVWSVECGVWSVECGVWSVECGVWNVECGVWSVE
jgi:hypothetical protein